ncbi:MAG: ATP-dependent Clp protease adapter protein ClpS [Burkholderia gladioli]|nr:MAG: ATP-dependent Clp protease adapter protein ClpS [Burkholderia gladioli]
MLLNDDFTPMECVVMVVQEYFRKERETAMQIMLKVPREGRGVCEVYTRDIASTKVEQVVTHALQAGHPLQCMMEET